MFKYKGFLLTTLLVAFLCAGFLSSSHAYQIISFPSDTEEYNYGYGDYMPYLITDVPYLWVEWWVNGTLVGIEWGDSTKTCSNFSPSSSMPGHIKGVKYLIKGYAAFAHEDAEVDWDRLPWNWMYAWELLSFMDFDDYTVTMFKPTFDSKYYDDGTYAYGRINRQYFDGSQILVDFYGYAHNYNKGRTFVHTHMVHDLTGHGRKVENHPKDENDTAIPQRAVPQRIGPGHGSYLNGHTIPFDNMLTDGEGGLQQELKSHAYIRVVVNGDDSLKVPSDATFKAGEKPYGELPK